MGMEVAMQLRCCSLGVALLASVVLACGDDTTTNSNENIQPGTTEEPVTSPVVVAENDGDLTMDVVLNEYSIHPSKDAVEAGEVTFAVDNQGKIDHQFIVVRSDLEPDALPVIGAQVDLNALEVVANDTLAIPDDAKEVGAALERGQYILICNQPAHYQSGMHARLTVR
jgi:uncharacterized cupredoxin-like copper-binding protein